MPAPDFFLITCEHGGNRIPAPYRPLFHGQAALLRSHRGYDAGALRLARDFAAALAAPLCFGIVSRLLIDLNRSRGHPQLYSDAMRQAPFALREEIALRYYLPYRNAVENRVAQAIEGGARVIHLSCHSFTPEMHGVVRDADIGLLYDPARAAEAALCRQWREALLRSAPALTTRMNYPYAGTDDGLTVHLRQRFADAVYLGLELEINQTHVRGDARRWRRLRQTVIDSFRVAVPGVVPDNR